MKQPASYKVETVEVPYAALMLQQGTERKLKATYRILKLNSNVIYRCYSSGSGPFGCIFPYGNLHLTLVLLNSLGITKKSQSVSGGLR